MNLSARILRWLGWTVNITVPDYPKCIICVAPHTSNWDFIIGKLAYAAVGRHAGFLMKQTWFMPPLSWIFRAMGGIPVPRKRGSSLSAAIIDKFNASATMHLAITPEGTRSLNAKWRTGFLHIAREADVPITLGVFDYRTRTVTIADTFRPTGDADADMAAIKAYYRSTGAEGRRPHLFSEYKHANPKD